MMRALTWGLLVAGVSLNIAACGITTRAGADYDRDAAFRPYGTYSWDDPPEGPIGNPLLEGNPFFEARLYEAVERQLSVRGIRHAGSAAALRVHHHISVQDHIEVFEAADASASSDFGSGTQVVQYEEDIFLVDVADASTGETIWLGWARGEIGRALTDPERMREWVEEAITLMFDDFPISGRGGP